MRRGASAIMLLVPAAAPSLGGNVTTFERGKPEAVAELKAPECLDTINITSPAECHIRKATMNVSPILPDKDNPDGPEAV